MFQAFPLQHKKMMRLSLPFIRLGVCEVMNCTDKNNMSSFMLHNTRNTGAYSLAGSADGNLTSSDSSLKTPAAVPFMAEVAAAGIFNSLEDHQCSRYIGHFLRRLLSLHSVLPDSIAKLRCELKDDPMVALILSALSCNQALHPRGFSAGRTDSQPFRRIFSEWEMQQYAMFADSTFLEMSRRKDSLDCLGTNGTKQGQDRRVADSGSHGVWFTASVTPFAQHEKRCQGDIVGDQCGAAPPLVSRERINSAKRDLSSKTTDEHQGIQHPQPSPSFCLDVLVSNVGDSRAFGISRHPQSKERRSALNSLRKPVVPLSVDHKPLRTEELRRITSAGGVVYPEHGGIIDNNSLYNLSRSFGHWSMKNNVQRPPSEQKIIAFPTCNSWEMLAGDVLVLCNHATFETRCGEDTSVDEIARVVVREIDRGASPEEVAGVVCDYAIRFGAGNSLQVLVAVAVEDTSGASTERREALQEEWVVPGPIYMEPCRRLSAYREALLTDCERCNVNLAKLLEMRWRRVRNILPSRHALKLTPYYGKECGAIQQIMEEEALLFSHESLPLPGVSLEDLTDVDWKHIHKVFEVLSRSLMTPLGPSTV